MCFFFCLVKDGFGAKNQLLPRKKMVFLRQTRPKPFFFQGKVGFSMKNHLFTRQNLKKKTQSFSTSPPHSLKKLFFLVFWSRPSWRPVLWSVWGLFCRETATESSKERHRARAGFKRYLRGKQIWVGHGGSFTSWFCGEGSILGAWGCNNTVLSQKVKHKQAKMLYCPKKSPKEATIFRNVCIRLSLDIFLKSTYLRFIVWCSSHGKRGTGSRATRGGGAGGRTTQVTHDP